jgi:hypothetical protein
MAFIGSNLTIPKGFAPATTGSKQAKEEKGRSAVNSRGRNAKDIWEEAYKALEKDSEGKKWLKKLSQALLEEQKQHGKAVSSGLKSEEGRKKMLELIKLRAKSFESSGTSADFGRVSEVMLSVKDIVATGAAAGSPFATIAVSGLFMIFSVSYALC